jgi:kynureninase
LDNILTVNSFRDEFVIPTKAQLKRKTLKDDAQTAAAASGPEDEAIYFCGNSLGLQPKAVSEYMAAYLKTWGSIAVGGHFTDLEDSPLTPYQDMAADCARKSADIVGASPEEIVIMNTLTVNLHLMMATFYKPSGKRTKIMCEWRPFPSDWVSYRSASNHQEPESANKTSSTPSNPKSNGTAITPKRTWFSSSPMTATP